MKILHIDERFHPDMGYQTNYFAEFHDPSIEFEFISSSDFSLWRGTDRESILKERDRLFEEKNNIKITRLDCSLAPEGKYWLWMKGLHEAISKSKPDVIYAHGIENITAMRVILGSLSRKHMIVSDTHTLFNQKNNSLTGKIYDLFFHNIYIPVVNRKNITVFYTADENRIILEDVYKIKKENIARCLIGTNLDDYRFDAEARKELRARLSIPEDARVILYTGKFDYKKQPHLILEAVKLIENKMTSGTHLVFVGAKNREYYESKFNFSSLIPDIKVHIFDSVSNKELFKYYSMADIGIFPKENTISSLDAQACRLPLIMEDDYTNRERLQKGGLVYKKDDIEDLAGNILLLLNDQEKLRIMGHEGAKYIKDNYDFRIIVHNMEREILRRYEKYKTRGIRG